MRQLWNFGMANPEGYRKALLLMKLAEKFNKPVITLIDTSGAFPGLSFYDARRWGVINPIAQGGGRTGAVLLSNAGVVSTNGTIEYGYLDYWDVPANELAYNPAAAGAAPVVNPKN